MIHWYGCGCTEDEATDWANWYVSGSCMNCRAVSTLNELVVREVEKTQIVSTN